jgi:hypothetical protein
MKEILQQIAGIIGIFCYIPLIIGIIRNRIAQSFVAFALWAMLDLIATLESLLLVAASQQPPFLSGRSLPNHQHALLVCNPSFRISLSNFFGQRVVRPAFGYQTMALG